MPPALDLREVVQTKTDAPTTTGGSPRAAPQPLLTWETPEHHLRPKTISWYAIFGVAMAILLFTAFLMRSFLSGAVFVLLGILVLLYSERSPRPLRVQLLPSALILNDRRYLWKDLDAFNIVESPTGMLALFRSRRLVMPLIHVPLADEDPEAVRAILSREVKEDTQLREPLPDLLAHYLGF